MRNARTLICSLIGLYVLITSTTQAAEPTPKTSKTPFVFRDVTREVGLLPALSGVAGHGAGWGDVDGDGWVDLYVGAFAGKESKANQLLRNQGGKFTLDDQPSVQLAGRVTGVVFADLDNDGDLDLYVASMPKSEQDIVGCRLLRNDGGGKFEDVSAGNAACPTAFGGRSAAVVDYDGDGRLDLLVGEDPLPRYNGSLTKSSRLFRNLGDLKFEDVTQAAGIPADVPGLGVAAGDLNNDGWPDLFLAAHNGGNVLLINDGRGKFREPPGAREVFAWKDSGGDNMICGVCFGDVNRDGLLDILIGQHYDHPWREPVPVRLYLNRGLKSGQPAFEDVTDAAGLTPLALKAPHVEIQDMDNDGWPDLVLSQVKFAQGQPHPIVFKNLGAKGGEVEFRADALAVNDYPTDADRQTKVTRDFYDKMLRDGKIAYMPAGPTADFDRDGKLDLLLVSWWPAAPSLLLRNETPGGHWLQVQIAGNEKVNRMGVGARVEVYSAGKLGQAEARLGCREIAAGYGYASGQPAIAHFGLGAIERVDLVVTLPHGQGQQLHRDIAADRQITLPSDAE